ncbi:MAG: hypothetical protein ACR2M0_06180 [Chloroflexia bacterium]
MEAPPHDDPSRPPHIHPLLVIGIFVVSFFVYALFDGQVLLYTNPPTGDQPFYLHTAISIVQDGDINEYNNYLNQDESQFYPRSVSERLRYPYKFQGILAPYPLPPHNGHTTNRPDDEWYSKHGLGLSVLIVPGWALGVTVAPPFINLDALDQPTGGWPMVVYEMNIIGALLAVQVFLLAYEASRRWWIALAVWAALAFSNPLMTYSYLIFPELPAGLCAIYAFRRLRLGLWNNGPLRLLLVGLAAGFLPWLHARFLPITIGLVLFALWGWWKQRRPAPAPPRSRSAIALLPMLLPVVVSAGLLMGFYYWLYGTVLPNTGDHAGFIDPLSDPLGLPAAMLGLLFDQQWGLLFAAPVYLLAAVGLGALWINRAARPALGLLLLITVPYCLLVSEYNQWWGEWCPPARYLATVAPLLALPLAQSLLVLRRSLIYWASYLAVAALGWAVMGGLLLHPHSFFNQPTGISSLFQWIAETYKLNLVPRLPSVVPWFFNHAYGLRWDLLLSWAALCAAIVAGGLLLVQRAAARGQGSGVGDRRPVIAGIEPTPGGRGSESC